MKNVKLFNNSWENFTSLLCWRHWKSVWMKENIIKKFYSTIYYAKSFKFHSILLSSLLFDNKEKNKNVMKEMGCRLSYYVESGRTLEWWIEWIAECLMTQHQHQEKGTRRWREKILNFWRFSFSKRTRRSEERRYFSPKNIHDGEKIE